MNSLNTPLVHKRSQRLFPHLLSLLLPLLLVLSACGGGGGSSSSPSSSSGSGPVPVTPPDPTSTANFPSGANVVKVSVDGQSFSALNTPFVSITLCNPSAPTNCLTIDHILVDTASVGLRVYSQPLNTSSLTSLNLPQQLASDGNPLVECLPFAQGTTWGPIKNVNLQVGAEVASNIAVQVISDPNFTSVPAACSNQGAAMLTPSGTKGFGANGVLGVGLYAQDCGFNCTTAAGLVENVYFSCSNNGSNCTNIGVPLASQVQHPVTQFAKDNNGVILTLNPIPASGATTVAGVLIFGVDTETNNVSSNTNTILVNNTPTDPSYGYITTVFNNQSYTSSFLDSGSNAYFFNAPTGTSITQCTGNYAGFYCPATTIAATTLVSGVSGSSAATTTTFNIANGSTLFSNNTYAAFNDLAGSASDNVTFDWGLPFFFGRSVYTVIDGKTTAKATGPYFGW